MKLEEMRNDSLGDVFFRYIEKNDKIQFQFNNYAEKAFYISMQSIEALEKSKNIIDKGNMTTIALGYWFISIESYINVILRIILNSKDEFDIIVKKSINARINKIFDLINCDVIDFKKSSINVRLNEFIRFRNDIFHDRYNWDKIEYPHTNFSSNPYNANQYDVLTAMLISLDFFNYFRSMIKGIDLMPDIMVVTETTRCPIKLDYLYENVTKPCISEILRKHKIDTDIKLNKSNDQLKIEIDIKEDHQILLQAKPLIDFVFNNSDTSICSNIMGGIRKEIDKTVENGKFAIYNFIRK